MPYEQLSTVGEQEAKALSHGSMAFLRKEEPTEAAKERRMRRKRDSAGWRSIFLNEKRTLKKECRRKSNEQCKKH